MPVARGHDRRFGKSGGAPFQSCITPL